MDIFEGYGEDDETPEGNKKAIAIRDAVKPDELGSIFAARLARMKKKSP